VRLSVLVYLYGRRLRTRPAQEMLAGVGVAISVALVFAVLVANDSIVGSSAKIVHSIAGTANLQLRSRDSEGFDQTLLARVQRLPGVLQTGSVLDQNASIVGPDTRRLAVNLASGDVSLTLLDGLSRTLPLQSAGAQGILLSSAAARALHVPVGQGLGQPEPQVSLQLRGRTTLVRVIAVLGSDTIGALSGAMAAIAPLPFIQRLAGLSGRVTRIFVRTAPGRQALVRKELEKVAAGRLTVALADQDIGLLKQATLPNQQATGFFVFVSALVGLLLAFNAMLLTTPERRKDIADLRIQGVRPRQLATMLLFQALCLGAVASLLGLLVGDVLSRTLFHQTPSYLAAAFPLGSQTIIGVRPLLLSFVGGVLATCLAATPPLLDLRRGRAVDAIYFEDGEPGQALSTRARWRMFATAVALVVGSSGLLILDPSSAIIATVALAVSLLFAIPAAFTVVLGAANAIAVRTHRLNMLLVATRALRGTTMRSLALAATGAIAVFGSVVAEGTHNDLLNGLYRDYSQYVATADLWVTNNGDELATMDFSADGLPARIAALPGVTAVRSYQGGFLDYGARRVWVIARTPTSRGMIPAGQIVDGSLRAATARLSIGGWVTISRQIAAEHHVSPGDLLTLPTPTGPVSYRIAATTTNLGWTAGAIVLNSSDYRHAWATADPSALEVDVRHGIGPLSVKRAIQRLLGPTAPLRVQTTAERASTADISAREGLGRLGQISLLLIIAAALAMAAAMGAAIWQRRPSLASLRIQSYLPGQLRDVLLFESGLVLGVGCFLGAVAGVYGHLLGDRYLRLATGFPAVFAPQGFRAAEVVALVAATALLVLAIPGYIASRVSPRLALEAQ
jgi:putative ABC transport system permease protein